jgi:hypothetical protein
LQQVFGPRGGHDVGVAHDGHDRAAGQRPGARLTEWPPCERRALWDREAPGLQARHLAGEVGEPLGESRRAQDVGQGVDLLGVQPEDAARPVGVPAVVDGQLRTALPPHDDAEQLAGLRPELVADADAGQHCLLEVHARMVAELQRP